MFLGLWQDVFAVFHESKRNGSKYGEVLPAACEKLFAELENRLPEEGFVHGGNTPSFADIICFNLVTKHRFKVEVHMSGKTFNFIVPYFKIADKCGKKLKVL